LIEQRAVCDLLVKSLVSLTDADESVLRRDLDANTGTFPSPVDITVASLPAEVLAQRPDIFASARELEQASAEADRANALRWPRVTLTGNIGKSRVSSEGVTTDGTVWSVGPVAVTIPLFDGGAARANASVAHARYEASVVDFAARLREAVREVESALVTLDSTAIRSTSVSAAAAGFASAYAAVNDRYRNGAANLFELEEVRRSMIAADRAVVSLRRERIVAWIDLYRAVGGGWSRHPINTADPQIRQP
jgi:outer membrane protein TolC